MPPNQNNLNRNNPLQQNGVRNSFVKNTVESFVQEKTIDDFVKKEGEEKSSPFLKPLRTYESDIAEIMQKRQGSLAKMAIAEGNKANIKPPVLEANESDGDRKKKMVLAIGSLTLIILSILIWAGFLIFGNRNADIENQFAFSPLFSADAQKEVSIDNQDKEGIIATLNAYKKAPLTLSTVLGIYFTEGQTDEKKIVQGDELFSRIGGKIPPALTRTFNRPVMFGIHSFKGGQPFFVLKTSNFENSFAGMLEWEKTIATDLKDIFPVADPSIFRTSTSTEAFSTKLEFEDIIIKNKDVRALKDPSGKIIFMYSFPERETLVITTIPDTFEAILSKLLSIRLVR